MNIALKGRNEGHFLDINSFNDESWRIILKKSIRDPGELYPFFPMDKAQIEPVIKRYPMKINPYYLGLIKHRNDPIYKQCVPDIQEIKNSAGEDDPLSEEESSPVPSIIHKYPDRVLFYVSNRCAMYCRFCNRKRKVGKIDIGKKEIDEGISYIKSNRNIKDVLLSGGDPLLLSDRQLFDILSCIRDISHVNIIRVGTRVPCTLPHRITDNLVNNLKRFHPLYINTHFNHPMEITPQSTQACTRLANAGIPLGCQTVLLKGVNDEPKIIKELMYKLLSIRVRPYYLFYPDRVRGTSHFWVDFQKGIEIFSSLHGHISGLGVPKLVIDLPGGGGKVPVYPEYVIEKKDTLITFTSFDGKRIDYNFDKPKQ